MNKNWKRSLKKRLPTKLRDSNNLRKLSSVAVVIVVAGVGIYFLTQSHAATPSASLEAENGTLSGAQAQSDTSASGGAYVQFGSAGGAPSTPPVSWCEDSNFPGDQDPYTSAPSGAVTVPAGNNSSFDFGESETYWFAPGTHTLGTSQYGQIDPASNSTFIGAPGAILSGQGDNDYAFVSNYQAPYDTGVTIEYLTIENFVPPGSQGAINQNGGPGWTIEYDAVRNNLPGSAMMLGTNNVVEDNCLTENGQYAFNGYSTLDDNSLTGGPENITLSHNEISYNNTCNFDEDSNFPITSPSGCSGGGQFGGCGCDGGGKFWETENVTAEDNYVHDNYSVGMWADTENDGITFKGNYISNNYGEGIMYEVSYNTLIEDNTFVKNGILQGETNYGFPTGAIYLSESGGDSRVPNTANINTITISNNVFTDNWDGVVLWENSNRFCGGNIVYGQPDSECTLVDPSVASSPQACANALENSSENQSTDNPDYFDLCRWKTQNVMVSNNTFNFHSADLGTSDCTTANFCGLNAIFSNYGSGSDGVPYTGAVVPINITFNQNNLFKNNTYNGAWNFMGWAQSNLDYPLTWAQWTHAVTDKCSTSDEQSSGTCDSGFGQDAGSTYNN